MNYTEKNRMIDRLCGVGLMAIFVGLFFGITNDMYMSFKYLLQMPTILNVTGAILLIIAIAFLIYGYKKDDGYKLLYGIEFLALAFMSALLPYNYGMLDPKTGGIIGFDNLHLHIIFPIAFGIYYLVKAIVIIMKAEKKR